MNWVSRINTLRRESDINVLTNFESVLFEGRTKDLLCCSGVGRTLQYNQSSFTQDLSSTFYCCGDKADVRITGFPQGCRDSNADTIRVRDDLVAIANLESS